jgi:hypothetical protein
VKTASKREKAFWCLPFLSAQAFAKEKRARVGVGLDGLGVQAK